jgi:hypothetical protein
LVTFFDKNQTEPKMITPTLQELFPNLYWSHKQRELYTNPYVCYAQRLHATPSYLYLVLYMFLHALTC